MVKTTEFRQPNPLLTYPDALLAMQIEQFFDLRAERRLINQLWQNEVGEREIKLYSQENLIKFLLEFAAGVKKNHITYQFNEDNQLIYPYTGKVMTELMVQAVENSGGGSREQAEYQGWQAMQALFVEQGASQVLQLSPPDPNNPNHGNYGFLFWFQKKKDKVINHILRYDENQYSLAQSESLARWLNFDLQPLTSNLANNLLRQPQGLRMDSADLKRHLEEAGLSFDDRGYLLEELLFRDPAFLDAYFRYQQVLVGYSYNESVAKDLLVKMYRLATEKAMGLDLFVDRNLPMPLIFMGGSCPTIQAGISTYDYVSYLFDQPFTCPNCQRITYSPVGNSCPFCKITKDEWVKKQKEKKADFDVCD